ncbi:hypothetical protein FHR71_001734 [Methylobacterium sp. RAS18]|nr:hypothetical protein [Methylobacterium sp. RAS18]
MPIFLQIALGIAMMAGALVGFFHFESGRLEEWKRAKRNRKSTHG